MFPAGLGAGIGHVIQPRRTGGIAIEPRLAGESFQLGQEAVARRGVSRHRPPVDIKELLPAIHVFFIFVTERIFLAIPEHLSRRVRCQVFFIGAVLPELRVHKPRAANFIGKHGVEITRHRKIFRQQVEFIGNEPLVGTGRAALDPVIGLQEDFLLDHFREHFGMKVLLHLIRGPARGAEPIEDFPVKLIFCELFEQHLGQCVGNFPGAPPVGRLQRRERFAKRTTGSRRIIAGQLVRQDFQLKIHRIRPGLEQKCKRQTAEGRVFRVIITDQRIDTARGGQESRTVFGTAGDHRFCQVLTERRGPLAGITDGGIKDLFELLFERRDQGDLRFRFRNFCGIRGFFRNLESLSGCRGPLLEFRCDTAENSFALLDCIRHPIKRMEGTGQFGFIAESPGGIDIVTGRVGMKERQRRLAGLFGAKFELQPTGRFGGQIAKDIVKFRAGQIPGFLLDQPRAPDVASREGID